MSFLIRYKFTKFAQYQFIFVMMHQITKKNKYLKYKLHPWHGVNTGDDAPVAVNCYVEVVPTDTVKYEVDKLLVFLK